MKIMLVDDDLTFLTIMEMMISQLKLDFPIQVVVYSNSKLAVSELYKHNPDIIFLDLFMPEFTGWDFLNAIQSHKINSKIIMLSSSVDEKDMEKAKSFDNLNGFISKPISFEKLKMVVN